MKIDAHQHFWEYDPIEYDWITSEMSVIAKSFLPKDLDSILEDHGIDGSVAVQARECLAETDFLLELAKENPKILGVVGWIKLFDQNLESNLVKYSQTTDLKGFREVLQAKDSSFFLCEGFKKGLKIILNKGYRYDILIFEHQLDSIQELVKSSPEKPMVIDHLAKPKIKSGEWKEWKKKMARLADREYLFCKISGMVTEANWPKWSQEQLSPYMDIALELFGPDRLMFGSDWPVCTLAGTYEKVYGIVEEFSNQLSKDEKEAIFGGTAKSFYKIDNK
ncbi:amidohydrolase family protein [Algoriphagus sediminis]|uniref:Amidohydrolase family protein n=1 Tax=Algoriphagus sediminis TaxID=3057113 RepID=A0ABT7Y7U5_9BACT|nr:amidohydrolase family protein [Algoriphagus sediminis]MDN3202515.1 amidohydrolase family protein [Algoriphagus sediminis]